MFDALYEGLTLVVQWPTLGYLMLGVIIGIWLGAVPGLGGALGIVLVLPFTYDMTPSAAFALLLGIYAVTSTSDTIASVMLGIPGTSSSQATILDGYPMAKKGEAARAFGAAFTVSAFGGVFGALVLAVSLPIALPVILKFNNPELFMLGMLGLVMVGSLSGVSLAKGLTGAAFGLILSAVGYADDTAIPRYWMGSDYLLDRIPLIPVVLGIFAVPELMDLAVKNRSIASAPTVERGFSQMFRGVKDAFEHRWLAIRCSFIGVYVGMIPGLGGAVVDWIAYGHAVQSSKNPETFGTGDVRGVIAPEAANNAVRGGALIPTVAFGVPGSAINALLLSALLIQGLQPGKAMLTSDLPITFSMVWTIAIANIIAAGLLMMWSYQVAKLAFISSHLIVPGVMLFVFMGAWLTTSSPGDWVTLLVFSFIGYAMKRGDWPRPPIILAFILGSLMENSFLLSWKIHQGLGWLDRPIVLAILALILLTFVLSIRKKMRAKKEGPKPVTPASSDAEQKILDDEDKTDHVMSIVIGIAMLGVFAGAVVPTIGWPVFVSAFPWIAIVPGLALALLAIGQDVALVRSQSSMSWRNLIIETLNNDMNRKALWFFGYFAASLIIAHLVGQKIAILIFTYAYLVRWGKYTKATAGLYTFVCWLLLIGFYDRIVQVFWHIPVFENEILTVLPTWFPAWLVL